MTSNSVLYEDFVNLLKKSILEYVYPKKENFLKNGKPHSWGRGDFQKAGQIGLQVNSFDDIDGEKVDDGYIYRNIPGVKYPFETKEQTFRGLFNQNDTVAKEIVKRILFGSENNKPRYLFFNGVVRMVCDGEVKGEKDYKTLSDICIYLSENPSLLSNEDPFTSKDWEKGFSNFYNLSFNELVKKFGTQAKQYCKEKSKLKVIESDLVTSNGYYVYPCYNFATANYVGSFMEQGMCYTGTDNFFHEHMGNSGVLFLFIKKDKEQHYDNNNKVYMGSGNLSLREFGIAVSVDVMKKPYIESITDGTNMSLYNSEYKNSKTSQYFDKNDIKELSKILGTLNGEEIFKYCLRTTKERQNSEYDSIFNSGTYDRYEKLLNSKHRYDKTTTEIDGVTVFCDNGNFICLDSKQEIVIIITKEGFITLNGNEIINANVEPTLKKISNFIGNWIKNWGGYKHNKRNNRKTEYHNYSLNQENNRIALEESLNSNKNMIVINENKLMNIIKNSIKKKLNERATLSEKTNVTVCSLEEFYDICNNLGLNRDVTGAEMSNIVGDKYAFIEIGSCENRWRAEVNHSLNSYNNDADKAIEGQLYFHNALNGEIYNVLQLIYDDNQEIDNHRKKQGDKNTYAFGNTDDEFDTTCVNLSPEETQSGKKDKFFYAGGKGFAMDDAKKIQAFVNECISNNNNVVFIIHCRQGTSRSAAVGEYCVRKISQVKNTNWEDDMTNYFDEHWIDKNNGKHQFRIGYGSKGPRYPHKNSLGDLGGLEGWNAQGRTKKDGSFEHGDPTWMKDFQTRYGDKQGWVNPRNKITESDLVKMIRESIDKMIKS